MSGLWATAGRRPRDILFRVHHIDSPTRRTPGYGFEAGSDDYLQEWEFHDSLDDHLNYSNRNPTPFISLSNDPQSAVDRAQWMKDEEGCRGVAIFIIDPNKINKKALDVRAAIAHLELEIPRNAYQCTKGEFVYMREIPERAIVEEYKYRNLRWFCRKYDAEE